MRRARAHGPYQHGNKWRVHFVLGSGRNRTTTYEVFASRAEAQKCYDDATDEAQGVTVSAAIKAFLDVKRAHGRAELTVVAYDSRLRMLLHGYLHRRVGSVARRGAELYASALAGRSADGHQNLLAAGRRWGKWCVRQRLLKQNPFTDVDPIGKRVHGADKAQLGVDESRKLEAWCLAHPDDIAAVLTLGYLYLGTRNTELARRNIGDLDDDGSILHIRKSKTRAGQRKLRIPPALGDMLRALCAGRAGDAPIFRGPRGGKLTGNAARIHVLRVCTAAGVTPLPPQALRRTQSSIAIAAGETSLAVARHLGQATGAAPKVTSESYIDRDVAAAAQGERALRVIRGGRP
jgi:integrase